jgi:hypothetical protein
MTVCVASLSCGGSCIICVADKALSYGDYIQWDSDTTKIIPLPSRRAVLMISGGENTSRIVNSLLEDNLGNDAGEIAKSVETIYQECYNDILEIKFIKQNGLTRETYLNALCGPQINRHIEHIAERVERFNLDVDLMICGYDTGLQPFMLSVTSPGVVVDVSREGFHAIGSGYDHAIARLLFQEQQRTHTLSQTLYGCFDAKAHAELASSVGYEWNGYLVSSSGIVSIEDETRELIERVWAKANKTPFEKRKKSDMLSPPRDWRTKLMGQLGVALERIEIPTLEGAVIVNPPPKQPAWRSQKYPKDDQTLQPPSRG